MNINRGFFGIGIENTRGKMNIGTLWRSANLMGATFIFTIGARYKVQPSDTLKTIRHIPLFHYPSFDEFYKFMPYDCLLIGIELIPNAIPIKNFIHPQRCIYLLGAEDTGLSEQALEKCDKIVQLPGRYSMNLAVAGSIIMFDRVNKINQETN